MHFKPESSFNPQVQLLFPNFFAESKLSAGETALPARCLGQVLRRMFARKANKLYLPTIRPNAPTFVGAFALY